MTMHLSSIWRDPRITAVPLSCLSPTTVHADYKHRTTVLPQIVNHGLWYPLNCVKFSQDHWQRRVIYGLPPASALRLPKPVINEDGFIWAIKMGCNRYQAARELGYHSIDCIFFDHTDDAVKVARWHQQCDPLHNPESVYMGVFDYK